MCRVCVTGQTLALSSPVRAYVSIVPASVAELAYDLSRASLGEQEKRLADLRSRAGTLLAAASIAGSFLASSRGELDTMAILASAAYVGCVATAVYVLLPHELVLEFRGSLVARVADEVGGELADALAAVTEWLEDFHDANASTLATLGRWYTASCAALGGEVLMWTLSVTGTL